MACQIDDELFNRIYIDNCGLTDSTSSVLFQGLQNLFQLKSVTLRHVSLGAQFVEQLKGIFAKFFPNNVDELRIENCKITKEDSIELCRALNGECYLKKLSLVQANLDEECILELSYYVENNRYIQDLDISKNQLRSIHMLPLIRVLTDNKRLKYLNLSWNFLVPEIHGAEVVSLID